MDGFLIPLFPSGSLASSVVTTVWVGVFVVCIFNLRFGWVLSGLVVPGYLVPLLISRPWSAATIVVESIVTYGVVWAYSERLSRWMGASSFFGRDRFFALVLTSVLVRVLADGWLWPALADGLTTLGYSGFDFRSNLQSFGLVIIALIANLFWKSGLLRGLPPLFVTIGITYLIVRYGLMEWTNFSVSGLSYMYEDIATSILASPKSYIILLTTAFIASRMNMVYGWDFNGILLPSLLALQWYQPEKILATFVESFIILMAASALLRTRWFAGTTIEGARKLLLFFNVGFAWKLLLGFMLPWVAPSVKITDYFAFGYILSTLIAVKIHEKEILARLTRATLQTSVVAVLVASAIGFGLTRVPRLTAAGADTAAVTAPVQASGLNLLQHLRGDKVLFYEILAADIEAPSSLELDRFSEALTLLREPAALGDSAVQSTAAALLAEAHYELHVLQGRYFYLRERAPARGRGIFVLAPGAASPLLVECATAAAERGSMEAAAVLFEAFGGAGLALSGWRGRAEGSGDVMTHPQTMFQAFHRTLAQRDVLQVRGYSRALAREISGRREPESLEIPELGNGLWVRQSLPPSLDLSLLKGLLEQVEVRFATPPYANRQREETRSGFAELLLSRAGLRKLRARAELPDAALQDLAVERRVIGYLGEWLFAPQTRAALRGSNLYQPPAVQELLFFDEEVLAPLQQLMVSEYRDGRWSRDGLQELRQIANLIAPFGYELTLYRDLGTENEYLVLRERDAPGRRHWGIYLFRLGAARDYLVEVPRPLLELGSFEYGVALFERLQARALLIGGAHPDANLDGSADLLAPGNRLSLFNLVNQVLLRGAGAEPRLVVQARAFGYRPEMPAADVIEKTQRPSAPKGTLGPPWRTAHGAAAADADVLVAVDDGVPVGAVAPTPLLQGLLDVLSADGLSYLLAGSSPAAAGYELGFVAQARYRQATQATQFVSLRLSPRTRYAYRQQTGNRVQSVQFEALGIATETLDLRAMLLRAPRAAGPAPAGLLEAVALYQKRPDIVTLRRIQLSWPAFRLKRVIDRDTLAAFLVVSDAGGALLGVFNLEPRQPVEQVTLQRGQDAQAVLDRFLYGSLGALLFGAGA